MSITMPTNTLSCTFFYDALIRDYDFYLLEVSKSHLAEVEKDKDNYNRHIIKNVTSPFIEAYAPLGVTKIDTFTYLCHFKKETPSPCSLNEERYSLIHLGTQELTKLKEITLFKVMLTIFHEKGLLMYNSDNHKFNQFFYMSEYKKGEGKRIAMEVEVREVDNQGKKRNLSLWFATRQFKQIEKRKIKVYSHNDTLYCPVKNKMNKGYTYYDVFVEEVHGKLRRADKIDLEEEGVTFWIKRAWRYNAKEILPFVDINNGEIEDFELTKISYYHKFKSDIERVAKEYLSLSYKEQIVEKYPMGRWTKESSIFLENLKRGLNARARVNIYIPKHKVLKCGGVFTLAQIEEELQKRASKLLLVVKRYHKEVKIVRSLEEGVLTMALLFSKEWYKKEGIKGYYEDPYLTLKEQRYRTPIQAVTVENMDNKDKQVITSVMVSLKELLIKDELIHQTPSLLVDHSQNDISHYSFYLWAIKDDEEKYHFWGSKVTNGCFSLPSKVESGSDRYILLKKALLKSDMVSLEFIYSTNNDKHFYAVSRTTLYPIGDSAKFVNEITSIHIPHFFTQGEIVDLMKRVQEEEASKTEGQESDVFAFELFYDKVKELCTQSGEEKLSHKVVFGLLDEVNKEERVKKSKNTLPKRKIKTLFEKKIGRKLRFNIKGEEKLEAFFPALTNIHYFYQEDTLYYNVGYGMPIKNVEKNNPFRRITPIKEEEFFLLEEQEVQKIDHQTYFTMLDVFFVKYAEATVKPYPIKYLEEGLKVLSPI